MLPLIFNLKNKKLAFIGAGKVAERRILKIISLKGFSNKETKITVISKGFTEKIKELSSREYLELIKHEIDNENLDKTIKLIKNYDIVFISTDDKRLNDLIEQKAKKLKLLVNRADKVSDVILPAYFETEKALISVSTRGKSPAYAKRIKNILEKEIKRTGKD